MIGGPVETNVRLQLFDSERRTTTTFELTRQKFLTVPADAPL